MTRFRFQLFFIMFVLSFGALWEDQASHSQSNLINPVDDPQFADLVQSNYSAPTPSELEMAKITNQVIQSEHQANYTTALSVYQQDVERVSIENSDKLGTRDILWICDGVIFALLLLTFLPWRRWNDNAIRNVDADIKKAGIVAGRVNNIVREMTKPSPIVGRDRLKTYSIADELSKWNTLLNDGAVSQEEFEVARKALLKKEP